MHVLAILACYIRSKTCNNAELISHYIPILLFLDRTTPCPHKLPIAKVEGWVLFIFSVTHTDISRTTMLSSVCACYQLANMILQQGSGVLPLRYGCHRLWSPSICLTECDRSWFVRLCICPVICLFCSLSLSVCPSLHLSVRLSAHLSH